MSTVLEQAREALKAEREKESVARKAADKFREDAVAEGVNFLIDNEAFEKYDALTKVADDHKERMAQLDARINEEMGRAGQKTRRFDGAADVVRGGGDPSMTRKLSLGHRLTEAASFREWADRFRAMPSETAKLQAVREGWEPVEMASKDEFLAMLAANQFLATTITGGSATSAGPFIQNDLIPGFIDYRLKRPTLASIVGRGETDSDTVEYVTQSAPTNSAAETAETTQASESTYPFATNTVNVQEITHWVPVTLRALADFGQIRTIANNELGRGVLDRLDTQIASGGGTGADLEGIYTAVSAAVALGAYTRSEAIHRAITTCRVAAGVFAEPDYIGMHPNDAQDLRLEQDANGQYIFGPPSSGGPFTAWGVPIIQSTVFTEGTPLVGEFGIGAMLWVREGLSLTSGLDGNDFTYRRVTLLASMRVAFKTVRPTAFCEVTGF